MIFTLGHEFGYKTEEVPVQYVRAGSEQGMSVVTIPPGYDKEITTFSTVDTLHDDGSVTLEVCDDFLIA